MQRLAPCMRGAAARWLPVLLLLSAGSGLLAAPSPAMPGLDPLLNLVYDAVRSGRPTPDLCPVRMAGGERTVDVFIRTEGPVAALRAAGAQPRTILPGIVTADVPVRALPALARAPGVVRVYAARMLRPTLDVSTPEILADQVHSSSPPNTGVGVLVGVVDTGVDFTHLDFVDEGSNTSRVVAIWDQTLAPMGGESNPSGYSYGVEYTQAQISDEVDGTPAGFVRERDYAGHGSHVLGIAGGDGSATGNGLPAFRFVGVAPGAGLVMVKAGNASFPDSRVLDGVAYVFSKATGLGRPAVVNLSLGSDLGPHDGTDPMELALSAASGPGRVVVVSGGNSANDDTHSSGSVPLGGTTTISFEVQLGAGALYFDIWYDGTDTMDVRVNRPRDGPTDWVGPGLTEVFDKKDGNVEIEGETLSPDNGDHEIFITISSPFGGPATAGKWSIELRRNAGSTGDGSFHAWTEGGQGTWFSSGVDADYTLGTPATAADVLAVGAYVTKVSWTNANGLTSAYPGAPPVGQIADFSSHGPTRDGRDKPELTGPGMGVASALSTSISPPIDNAQRADDGVHWVLQGTSMSAPHIAGTVALMLYRDHDATPAQIIANLEATARTDAFTGPTVPSTVWGYGKVDALATTGATPTAVLAHLLGLDLVAPHRMLVRWRVPRWADVAACRPVGSAGLLRPHSEGPTGAEYELVLSADAARSTEVELIGTDGSVKWRGRLVP